MNKSMQFLLANLLFPAIERLPEGWKTVAGVLLASTTYLLHVAHSSFNVAALAWIDTVVTLPIYGETTPYAAGMAIAAGTFGVGILHKGIKYQPERQDQLPQN